MILCSLNIMLTFCEGDFKKRYSAMAIPSVVIVFIFNQKMYAYWKYKSYSYFMAGA